MKLIKLNQDLFEIKTDYYVQCISSDLGMGKGIAVSFNKNFNEKERLMNFFNKKVLESWQNQSPIRCIIDNEMKVINLITKERYWGKPTYDTLRLSLSKMKELLPKDNLTLGMPKIGCGLDKLDWDKVEEMIKEIFDDTDYKIIICYL